MKNFGVEFPTQSSEVIETMQNNNLEKYGCKFTLQVKEFREKGKITSLHKYGFEYPTQCHEVKNKTKETCLEKYGVDNPSKTEETKEKYKNTCLQKYGVNCTFLVDEFIEKSKKTCLKKYGVEYPTQCPEIMAKCSKNAYKLKEYVFPSGRAEMVQGTEPLTLDKLIKEELIDENDIIVGAKNVPTIWYKDSENKERRHYVDIFIRSQNRCVESKSTWTAEKKKDNIFLKQEAAKNMGYKYELWIYNNKGDKLEIHN